MKRPTFRFSLGVLVLFSMLAGQVRAGIDSKAAAYVGGTAAPFKETKDPIEGQLSTRDDNQVILLYGKNSSQSFSIPYSKFVDIEYGQKAGRRVGTAVATTVLLGPVGLVSLFSKKRKHFVTIGYKDTEEKDQVAIFELGKDTVRTTLAIIETRSGKKIEYQDKDAEKSGKSGRQLNSRPNRWEPNQRKTLPTFTLC